VDGETRVYVEDKFVTIGDEVNEARRFMKQDENGMWSYSAKDVVEYLKSEWEENEFRKEIEQIIEKKIFQDVNEAFQEQIGHRQVKTI
jgi:hypothetical protein